MTDLATYVTALAQTWDGVLSACANLLPAQWDLPTDLPGWSVKDNVSHIAGLEQILLGNPQPADHVLPESLPHVRNDAGRFMEVAVDLRRPVPGDAVLAEFRSATRQRLDALRALPESALDEEAQGLFGRMPLGRMLGIRTFDCWAHEQDIRRALGHPGGLSSAAAEISRRRLLLGLTGLAEDVPAAAGKTFVVVTTGAIASESTLRLGEPASYDDGAVADPDVAMTVDFETFVRLGTGRVTFDAVSSSVSLAGDVSLGAELARHLAVTP